MKCNNILLGTCIALLAVLTCSAQSWQQRADLSARSGAVSFTLNNKLYVGGGASTNATLTDFWEFDPAANTWTRKADLPGTYPGCSGGIAFSINGRGYVGLGTGVGTGPEFYRKELWAYDPATNTWAQRASLPVDGREGAACFVLRNKAYVVGGAATYRFGDVWEYDAVADAWTSKGNFPAGPIIYAAGFTLNDKGYINGGYPDDRLDSLTTKTYQYDEGTNRWTQKARFPGIARQGHVAFVLNNKAYCGLGTDKMYNTFYPDFFSYDAVTNTWRAEENFPGGARAFATAATVGNKAYAGTGYSNNTHRDVYEFTPAATGMQQHSLPGITVHCYPNPADRQLWIRTNLPHQPIHSYLYDMTGKQIAEAEGTGSITMDVQQLAAGAYLLQVYEADGPVRGQRIIYKQ